MSKRNTSGSWGFVTPSREEPLGRPFRDVTRFCPAIPAENGKILMGAAGGLLVNWAGTGDGCANSPLSDGSAGRETVTAAYSLGLRLKWSYGPVGSEKGPASADKFASVD